MASWTYDALSELTPISLERFSGLFALVDIQMTYGRYWITQSLDNVQAEIGDDENECDES
jgi:hypothetical protein